MTPELQDHLDIPVTGVMVVNVMQDTPAADAGIKRGDIIVRLSDKKISQPIDLLLTIDRLSLGVKHEIRLIRDGKEISAFVVLKEKPIL